MSQKITFRLTDNSYHLLKHICNIKGLTMTELITNALQYYIFKSTDMRIEENNDLPFN